MNRNINIAFSLIGLGIVAVLVIFWYPMYKAKKTLKEEVVITQTTHDLEQLILKEHDCTKVLEQASAFLKTNAGSEQIWTLKGACEFDLGKLDDAKASFNKVLVLNPESVPAKKYLEKINPKPGLIFTSGPVVNLNKEQFEIANGVTLGGILHYDSGEKRESTISSVVTERYSATYRSVGTFNATVSYLKTELQKKKLQFTTMDLASSTAFMSTAFTVKVSPAQENFTVVAGTPVLVIVKYSQSHVQAQ